MSNILLVEPAYRSKFPPLGLMRLSSYHKERGDSVTFLRGKDLEARSLPWHKIYVSSLFTWELPRTVETVRYYRPAVSMDEDIVVGGVGATLYPEYIRLQSNCAVVEGPLDAPNKLGLGTPAIASHVPDYSIVNNDKWGYSPRDSYFCRATLGCVRSCGFCAVPRIEPTFSYCKSIANQVQEVDANFGDRQHLVLLDNNVLASEHLDDIISEIRDCGFQSGAKRRGRIRTVDFNQGIDARLISPEIAAQLASICLSPVRLAFDFDAMETQYRNAVSLLAKAGLAEFTNYVLFNYKDSPRSLYRRLEINLELSSQFGIHITGFPMRFIPMKDVSRRYVSPGWKWRYLRSIQCILLATHGMVSPNPEFFRTAFGQTYEEFEEIIAMPDPYIIHRTLYKDSAAKEWRKLYRKLSGSERNDFLDVLAHLNTLRGQRNLDSK